MAHDVFISYSTKDKVIADAVCAKLEENKIRVWIAPRDVPAGTNFAKSIITAINACKVFVLIWSENTSEHILTEVNQAFDRSITIIPFRIQNIQPTEDLQYYIGRTHWLDAIDPPLESHIKDLIDTVNANLGRDNLDAEMKPPDLTEEAFAFVPEKTEDTKAAVVLPPPPPVQFPQKEFNSAAKRKPGMVKLIMMTIGIVAVITVGVLLIFTKLINPSMLAKTTPSLTPTSTTIPTPKATTIPPSNFLFILDFEDDKIGDWDNRSSTPLEIRTEGDNNYLHFLASGDVDYPGFWMIPNDTNWKDYAFESRVRFINQGIAVCFYAFNYDFIQGGLLFPSGVYFSDYVADRSVPYQNFADGAADFEVNRWYLVRIEVLGDKISMYIDNQLKLTAQRDSIPYGGIGYLSNTANKGEIDVDDIRVWKLK